jgi:hypothetical protein
MYMYALSPSVTPTCVLLHASPALYPVHSFTYFSFFLHFPIAEERNEHENQRQQLERELAEEKESADIVKQEIEDLKKATEQLKESVDGKQVSYCLANTQ